MKRSRRSSTDVQRTHPRALEDFVASALAFLAADVGRFDRFLSLTGLDVAELRTLATTRSFAESLLDYVCSDSRLLLAYAADSGRDPAAIETLRQSLAPAPFDG